MKIMAGLPADSNMEYQMLENNLAGLTRAEIERVVGDKYNRLLRQQHKPKNSVDIERHHTRGSRQEEEQETPQRIRG